MASVDKINLVSGVSASVTGDKKSLNTKDKNFIAVLTVSAYTAGTAGGKLQHSPDGTNWKDVASGAFTGLTATGIEVLAISASLLPNVRAVTSAGFTATVSIDLFFDPDK